MKVQNHAQPADSTRSRRPRSNTVAGVDRRFPVGAEVIPDGGVHFRVWAPKSKAVAVRFGSAEKVELKASKDIPLKAEANGYFSGHIADAAPNMLYRFGLDSGAFPDPVSRFQPQGPHGPSQIVDPASFAWSDQGWRGVPRKGQVIYEMHIGTFTPEGTWEAASRQLPECGRPRFQSYGMCVRANAWDGGPFPD